MFSSVAIKLFALTGKNSIYASENYGSRIIEIANTRGTVYDVNFKKLVNNEVENYLILKPAPAIIKEIEKLKNKEKAQKALKEGELFIEEEPEGIINDSENALNIKIVKRYGEKSLCHIIGYTNLEEVGVCGIEKAYNDLLSSAKGTLSAVYKTDALGKVLISESIEIRDESYNSASGVVLTIDKDIQKITYNAMVNGNIKKGAAIVINVKTGEIAACVSLPLYNQEAPSNDFSSEDSPFLNRAFTSFSVGSVFKVVTAAAAIENNITDNDFICEGFIEKSGVKFSCNNQDGHGSLNLNKALCVSCNPYFIELSTRVGASEMLKYAKKFGFSFETELNGITAEGGNLPTLATLDSAAAIGNLGFGQGELLATPLQLAACYSALACDGVFTTPFIVKGIVGSDGKYTEYKRNTGKKIIKAETARAINEYLYNTVNEGTGIAGKSNYFNSCGKTATAETGTTDKNGRPIYNTWFVGFFPYESPEYTVCILKEDGASGSYDDAPIFKEISENIYFLNNRRRTQAPF